MAKPEEPIHNGYETVFTAYVTLKNGKRIYAASYGKKAFCLKVRRKKGK
jgi:hypothetical protein